MEAVSPCGITDEIREAVAPLERVAATKAAAADSEACLVEAGQSTVCCSSEDEYPSAGAYPSDDERQDSDSPTQQQQQQQTPPAGPKVTVPELQLPRQPSQMPGMQTPAYTYTISNLEDITVEQPPSSWLKPRIKIDGPEVFHGANPLPTRRNSMHVPA